MVVISKRNFVVKNTHLYLAERLQLPEKTLNNYGQTEASVLSLPEQLYWLQNFTLSDVDWDYCILER